MIIGRHKPKSSEDFEKNVQKEHFLIFLLWLISKKNMHGYEIIKILQSDEAIPSVAISKVYPLLGELARRGFISQKKVLHGKRVKKLYRLAPKGRTALRKAREHMQRSPLAVQFAKDMML